MRSSPPRFGPPARSRPKQSSNVASNIQRDMLPNIFPAFPDRSEFDVYATMDPAKEVGGDFYDFFMIDQTHLAVVIADVSGKGVPAALFMVIAKTIIRNQAQSSLSPAEIFTAPTNSCVKTTAKGCSSQPTSAFWTCGPVY